MIVYFLVVMVRRSTVFFNCTVSGHAYKDVTAVGLKKMRSNIFRKMFSN